MKSSLWKNYRFPIILLCAIIIGCVLGVFLKEDAVILKPFGSVFLNLMYTIVVPLVFFTISSSIANMVNFKICLFNIYCDKCGCGSFNVSGDKIN